MGVRPSMGAWGTLQWLHPKRRKGLPPQQLPTANNFLEGRGLENISPSVQDFGGLDAQEQIQICFLS